MRNYFAALAVSVVVAGSCDASDVSNTPVPSCTDGVKNGPETDVDCGGACGACAQGKACVAATDCRSPDVCVAQKCVAPSCTDSVKDGTETDVDCGGSCMSCPAGKSCAAAADCQSGVCSGTQCQAPSCTDSIKNSTETDVDCGGSCGGCAVGKACGLDTDCNGSVCSAAKVCTYATSCNALHIAQPNLASGVYSIQPMGAASAYPVYCDMVDSGGGWTLVLKINGTQNARVQQNFSYDNALWTNATTLNDTSTDLSVTDAKFQSFSTLPFTQIMVAMTAGNATPTLPFAADRSLVVTPPGTWASMMALFQQPANTVTFTGSGTAQGAAPWLKLPTTASSAQANCNSLGINVMSGNCGGFPPAQMARVRIGLLTNQENDCCSPDSYAGFGGQYTYAACYATTPWHGPTAGILGGGTCTGSADVQNMGYVFVR